MKIKVLSTPIFKDDYLPKDSVYHGSKNSELEPSTCQYFDWIKKDTDPD